MTKISNYKFQLRGTLLVGGTTVAISNDLELDAPVVFTNEACVITNRDRTIIERVRASATGGVLTLLKRGMEQDSETEDAGLKKEWREGAICYMTILGPQLVDLIADNTFTGNIAFSKSLREPVYADATARDAGIPSPLNGMRIYNTALGLFQKYQAGSWEDDTSGGATPNASETVAGKVEIATQAEFDAGTETGATGAILSPKNDQIRKQINTATAKTTPVNADFIGIADSADSGIIKKTTLTQLKAASDMQATTTTSGFVEMATDAEALAGTDETRYINPKQAKDNYGALINVVTGSRNANGTESIAHGLARIPYMVLSFYSETSRSGHGFYGDGVQTSNRVANAGAGTSTTQLITLGGAGNECVVNSIDATNLNVTWTDNGDATNYRLVFIA